MSLFLILLTGAIWLPFRSEFDPREVSIDYILLERARIKGALVQPITIKPIPAPLKFSFSCPESTFFATGEGSDLFLSFKVRNWGYFYRASREGQLPSIDYENYFHLYGIAYLRKGNFEIYHATALYNEQRNTHNPLKFYDPFINPDFKLYTFDILPPIGHVHLFDVRTDVAYIHYARQHFDFTAGRIPVRLGPGFRSGLFLSGYALPLVYLYNFRVSHSFLQFMAAYAIFPDTIKWKRIAYQRLVVTPFDWLEMGFNQGVVWTDSDPLKYINPADLYYIVQRRGRDNSDNLIGGTDISIYWKGKAKFYAEFFDDDFIISGGSPSKYGIMFGVHFIDPFSVELSDLIAEFTHVNPWTYPHIFSDYRSTPEVLGYPIGFWGGPACNVLSVDFIKFTSILPGKAVGFRLGYEFMQHADQDMRSGWKSGMSMTPPPYDHDVRHSFRFFVFRKTPSFSYEGGIESSLIQLDGVRGTRVAIRLNIEGVPLTLNFARFKAGFPH